MLDRLTSFFYDHDQGFKRIMWCVLVILYCTLAIIGGVWLSTWSEKVVRNCYGFTVQHDVMSLILSGVNLCVGGIALLVVRYYYNRSDVVWPWVLPSIGVPIAGWIVSFILGFCVKIIVWVTKLAIEIAFGILGVIISVFLILVLIMGDVFDKYN